MIYVRFIRLRWLLVVALFTACTRGTELPVDDKTSFKSNQPPNDATFQRSTTQQILAASASLPGSPVTANLFLDRNEVAPGDSLQIKVEVRIEPGWHIYASDKPTGASHPTRLACELPAGLESIGPWLALPPMLDPQSTSLATYVYVALTTFSITTSVSSSAAEGTRPIRVTLGYQACDRLRCRPYEELELATEIRIINTRR